MSVGSVGLQAESIFANEDGLREVRQEVAALRADFTESQRDYL